MAGRAYFFDTAFDQAIHNIEEHGPTQGCFFSPCFVLREISTDSLESWALGRSSTEFFEVSTPVVKICYKRANNRWFVAVNDYAADWW